MGFYVSVFKLCESTEQTDRQTDRLTECNSQWTIYRTGFIRVYLPVWKYRKLREIYILLPVSRDL